MERICLPKNNVTKRTFRYFLTNPSVTVATMMRTCQNDEAGGSLKSHLGTKVPFKKNEDVIFFRAKNVKAYLQKEGCLENKN